MIIKLKVHILNWNFLKCAKTKILIDEIFEENLSDQNLSKNWLEFCDSYKNWIGFFYN
jgi:hypothetical protein